MTKQIFLPSDGPTGTPSLRTLGTGSTQAAAGNDSRLSDTRTPTAHASTHDVGGSDVLKDLTRLEAGPPAHGYIAWSEWITLCPNGANPTNGIVYLLKVMTAHAYTINNVDVIVQQAGTGATSLANCFVGIYDSGGTRRFVSADQSSAWASTGVKAVAVSGGYTVSATDFIYVALLAGTQATTPVKFYESNNVALLLGANLTAGTYRAATILSGQTSLPSSLTLASSSQASSVMFFTGVR